MSESETSRALVERVQQGQAGALDELCHRYLARVYAAVRIQLGAGLRAKVESGDIVQDVMIDAVRRLKTFDFQTEGAFLHYLNRVVANKVRDEADRWKASKRDQGRESPLAAERSGGISLCPSEFDSAGTPSKIVSRQEDLELLERALDRLAEESAEYRDLVVGIKLEGRSYAEIAEETGTTPDAVRMRVNRAMKSLTGIFRQIEGGG